MSGPCPGPDERGSGQPTLGTVGIAYADLGETRRAIEHYEQGLPIGRQISDPWIIRACENGLKRCRDEGPDPETARSEP